MPNLTIDNTTVDDLSDIFKVEKPEKLTFTQDPIALGCAVHRKWLAEPGHSRWQEFDFITPEPVDYEQAADIRKYYGDRILMQMLAGRGEPSSFRKKLYGLVSGSMQLDKKDIGLLYRLPYFYQEDLALDRVAEKTQPAGARIDYRITDQFEVIERVLRSRNAGDYTQLWLKGTNSKAAFVLTIKCDNPYHRMITALFSKPVTLSGLAIIKQMQGWNRGRTFYYLADIELE